MEKFLSKFIIFIKKIGIFFKTIKIYKDWPLIMRVSLGDNIFKKNKRIVRLRKGISFYVNSVSDIHILKEIFTYGHYDRFLNYLKTDSVVIDIGAHIGVFSILAANNGVARVLSFEPLPENFNILKNNISLNNLNSKIYPFQIAVSGSAVKAERDFFFFTERTGSSFYDISGQKASQVLKVKSISLSDIFFKNNLKGCDFLKIDCEGAEHEILFNTPLSLLALIKTITVETHDQIYGNTALLKLFLEKNNFIVDISGSQNNLIFAKNSLFI